MSRFFIESSYCSVAGLFEWEKFNQRHKAESLFQSRIWIGYLAKAGIPFFRLTARHKQEIVAQLLVWLEPPARISNLICPGPWIRLLNLFTPRICWQGGPIFNTHTSCSKDEILSVFVQKLRRKNVLAGISSARTDNPEFQMLSQQGFLKYHTYLINLQQDETSKWNNLHKSAQKNIRKNTPLEIRSLNNNEYCKYQKLLKTFRKAIGQPTSILTSGKPFYQEIKNGAFFEFVGAFNGSQLVGALGLFGYGSVLTEIGVARDLTSPYSSLSQDLIKWHIIKNGGSYGFRYYDLAGFEPQNTSLKAQNIRRFKEKWGGQDVSFWCIKKQVT